MPRSRRLLIDLATRVRVPVVKAFREPHGNLTLGTLHRVASVADVASDIDGEVSSDSAGGRLRGLGGTEHDASCLDGTLAFPCLTGTNAYNLMPRLISHLDRIILKYHAAHRSRGHVVDEAGEESLGGEISIVGLKELARRSVELQSDLDIINCDKFSLKTLEYMRMIKSYED